MKKKLVLKIFKRNFINFLFTFDNSNNYKNINTAIFDAK